MKIAMKIVIIVVVARIAVIVVLRIIALVLLDWLEFKGELACNPGIIPTLGPPRVPVFKDH